MVATNEPAWLLTEPSSNGAVLSGVAVCVSPYSSADSYSLALLDLAPCVKALRSKRDACFSNFLEAATALNAWPKDFGIEADGDSLSRGKAWPTCTYPTDITLGHLNVTTNPIPKYLRICFGSCLVTPETVI